jgi:U2 small nuclear ribonucleoprotein B''
MTTPNNTIYIKNLNDGINKQELRSQLYALFLPYGQVLDVIALKTPKMRGQAFVVFSDLVSATSALRAWDGELFYDKPMVSITATAGLNCTQIPFLFNSESSLQKQSPGLH